MSRISLVYSWIAALLIGVLYTSIDSCSSETDYTNVGVEMSFLIEHDKLAKSFSAKSGVPYSIILSKFALTTNFGKKMPKNRWEGMNALTKKLVRENKELSVKRAPYNKWCPEERNIHLLIDKYNLDHGDIFQYE